MRGRWLGCLVGCGGGLALLGLLGLGLLWRWSRPAAVAETIPPPAAPPAHYDNALAALADCLPENHWRLTIEQGELTADAVAWLATHRSAFLLLGAAAARPECAWTLDDRANEQTGSRLAAVTRLWQCRALRAWEQGDLDAALADARAARRLLARAARGARTLGDHAAATLGEEAALCTYHLLLRPAPGWRPARPARSGPWPLPRLRPADRRLWQAELRDLLAWHEEPAALQAALRADYHHAVSRLPAFPWRERLVQQRRARTTVLLHNATRPRAQRTPVSGWLGQDSRLQRDGLLGRRANLPRWYDDRVARIRLTAAAIALRLYVDQAQRLPSGWTDLVRARLLPAPPIDPATGQPVAWTVTSGRLVGLGDNAKRDAKTQIVDHSGYRGGVRGGDDVLVPLTFVRPDAAWETGP
ncbi:MAG: hypothetical protein IT204_13060 [Fimbriimonadaceae bacterium]|nr:hypothetical protein [Fimbriimonadaceae bacterium]